MGAAFVWREPEGWRSHRFHLGNNKEVFDAEVFAIYRALHWLDSRQERGRQYTLFADSTAAIERVRTDHIGPGQRFAIAAMEACDRILTRENQVTIRWVPSHSQVEGTYDIRGRNWLGVSISSSPDTQRSVPTSIGSGPSTTTGAGGATPASGRPVSTWWPGARRGPARPGACGGG